MQIKKHVRSIFAAGLLLLSQISQVYADNSLCEAAGYTLVFFNGVWNSYREAADSLEALRELLPDTYNSKSIAQELLYNHTGCGTVGATCLQDLAEVFIQRAQDIDSTGQLQNSFEFFWESIGSGSTSFTNAVTNLYSSSASLFSALYTAVISQIAAGWSYILSNPPTAADYAAQNARLDALAVEGQMLLMVGHSQGNLFLNQGYDHIVPTLGTSSVSAVQVAPASTSLRGPYELADIDLVINALRAQGLSSVPDVNLTLPTSTDDVSGHTLVGTYLDGSRPGRAAVSGLMNAALSALAPPAVTGNSGSFTVTLTWSGIGDEDLHVFEPNGAHVYYASRQGVVGYLDVDNTVAYGPEHYYASCDPSVLQPGTYQVALNDYNGADGETATVQVATADDGVILTKTANTGTTRGSSGDNSPLPILTVVVAKDPATGEFTYTAQ